MVGAGWCLYGCDEFGVGLPILSLFQIPTHELWMSIETLRVVVGWFRAKVLLGLWKLSWRMHYTSKMLLVFHFSDFEKHCLCVGFNLGLFFSEKHIFFWFLICQAGGTMSARCWVALGIWPSDPMQGRLERGRVLEFSTLWGEDSDPLKFYGRICSFRPGDFAERNSTNVRWFLRCWMYGFFQICAKWDGELTSLYSTVHVLANMTSPWLAALAMMEKFLQQLLWSCICWYGEYLIDFM